MGSLVTARERWKKTWRRYRILRREATKASVDLLVFGSACLKIERGEVRHVPLHELKIRL